MFELDDEKRQTVKCSNDYQNKGTFSVILRDSCYSFLISDTRALSIYYACVVKSCARINKT